VQHDTYGFAQTWICDIVVEPLEDDVDNVEDYRVYDEDNQKPKVLVEIFGFQVSRVSSMPWKHE
jgi:hypothetical protein